MAYSNVFAGAFAKAGGAPAPLLAGGVDNAIVPIGVKVWPVRTKELTNAQGRVWNMMYATKHRILTQNVKVSEFQEIPKINKFERFIEANEKGRTFVIGLFARPIQEKDDAEPSTFTVGFIFELDKASNIVMKDKTTIRQP